jgi:hypothetical protein
MEKHISDPPHQEDPRVAYVRIESGKKNPHAIALGLSQADAPADYKVDTLLLKAWESDVHALAGVNCSQCHEPPSVAVGIQKGEKQESGLVFHVQPSWTSCQQCHGTEAKSFGEGRHGMRLAQGLPAMTPGEARIPMKAKSAHLSMDCNACHSAHEFDTRPAAKQDCLSCHDDEHTRAYENSPHARLWVAELEGRAQPGTGVSCATCHMPRILQGSDSSYAHADHNQNNTLRPNEKMLRPVCLECHGLGFAIDALADRSLIATNFTGKPKATIASLDMVRARIKSYAQPAPIDSAAQSASPLADSAVGG